MTNPNIELTSPLVLIPLFILILIIIASRFRVVPQSHRYVVQRIGTYHATWSTGLHFLVPIIDQVYKKVTIMEQVSDFPPQPVITKDNVTMQIDTVVYFQITEPKLYSYGVLNPMAAIENLTATTLRNIIGDLELDESLTSRDLINTRMRAILDVATDPWGIKINRVEIKNIIPPIDIQQAMEKQMRAEREKRAAILTAEGQKQSVVIKAEGEKQSAILRAEAQKEVQIREAEGQAEAILKVNRATADGLQMLKDVGVDQGVIAIKQLDALAKVADGQATKLIIPSDIASLSGLVASLQEVSNTTKN